MLIFKAYYNQSAMTVNNLSLGSNIIGIAINLSLLKYFYRFQNLNIPDVNIQTVQPSSYYNKLVIT